MKSRTSFFNFTILKKDITRFFPVWGLYSLSLLLYFVVVSTWAFESWSDMLITLTNILESLPAINLIYAGICAMVLFGDLYKGRLCNAIHAMPVRRESWFFSHLAAAALFCIVPNAVLALWISPGLDAYWYLAFVALGISVVQFLAFFGIATFAVMCAGTKFGMAVAYVTVNLWSTLVDGIASVCIYPMLYGIKQTGFISDKLCPAGYAFELSYLDTYNEYISNYNSECRFKGFVAYDFWSLAILAAIGIALLVSALLLYRRRKLEKAGEFMAVRPAAAVCQLFMCLYGACVFVAASDIEFLGIVGAIVGFFGGKMLLERRVNVFRKKVFVQCGAVLAVLVLVVLVVRSDPMGITKKIPQAEDVKSVRVYSEYGAEVLESNKPEDIQLVIQMQEKLIREKPHDTYYGMNFEYTMKDGSTFLRYYPISVDCLDQDALTAFYSDWKRVFCTEDWDRLRESVVDLRITDLDSDKYVIIREKDDDLAGYVLLDAESRLDVWALLEAMKTESGKVRPTYVADYNLDWEYTVVIELKYGDALYLMVSSECTESMEQIHVMIEKYGMQTISYAY